MLTVALSYLHSDRFYTTPKVIAAGGKVEVVGYFSELEMAVIKSALGSAVISADLSRSHYNQDIPFCDVFEDFITNAQKAIQFLNKAYFHLSNSDYSCIREFLGLRPMQFDDSEEMMCDCEDHKLQKPVDEITCGSRIGKIWERIFQCATEVGANINDPQFAETVRILGLSRISTICPDSRSRRNHPPSHYTQALLDRKSPDRTPSSHHRKL
jgi:hypothetical protein